MDCQPAFRPAFAALSSLALAVSLSACASTSDRYPSLAIRDVERFYGSAQPVDANPAPPPPVQPSPAPEAAPAPQATPPEGQQPPTA